MMVTRASTADSVLPVRPTGSGGRIWSVFRAERRKLASQLAIRLVALICVLGPFVFVAILKVQSGSPSDTLYGGWVHSSGFAVSLVMLAFAGSWGFPLVAGIVAGDMFSAEDRYGTWKLVLTRSCTRRDMFAGKLLAAAAFTIGLVALTTVASLVAGVVLIGDQSLVNLNGTQFSPGKSLGLVLASWLLCVPPTLAFMSLAVMLSIATRNGIMGVIGPGLAALVMQLLLLVGSGIWMHTLLVSSAFNGWHALFRADPFYGALIAGLIVSVIWIVVCLRVSWSMLRRRDFAGVPVGRRQGWVMPVRVALACTGVIALLAIASNWGPVGVTAKRLQGSLIPTFTNLTLLQQRELGRVIPPGAKLNIVLPSCSRRGSAPRGPGDWVCTLNVLIPTPGYTPPQPTPVTYDVSVQSDGCYKAQSPPAFIGQQLMRDANGHNVVNPLYTIYGCFNTM
jgi:ABC-2 type transport system permease protein